MRSGSQLRGGILVAHLTLGAMVSVLGQRPDRPAVREHGIDGAVREKGG